MHSTPIRMLLIAPLKLIAQHSISKWLFFSLTFAVYADDALVSYIFLFLHKKHHIFFFAAPSVRIAYTAYWNVISKFIICFSSYFERIADSMTLCRQFEGQTCKFRSHGGVQNKNTIEEFKKCDKAALLNEEGAEIWQDITSGLCVTEPSRLSRFTLIAFAVKCHNDLWWILLIFFKFFLH